MATKDEYLAAANSVRGVAGEVGSEKSTLSSSGWESVVTGAASVVSDVITELVDLATNTIADAESDIELVADRLDDRAATCEEYDDLMDEYETKKLVYDENRREIAKAESHGLPPPGAVKDPGKPPAKPYPWVTRS